MSDPKKCIHVNCQCKALEGSEHCSNYCKAEGSKHEHHGNCDCGHAACDSPPASAAH